MNQDIVKQIYHLSDEIVRARMNKGHNQYDASKKMGISRALLSHLESGKNKNPSIETLIGVLNYLDMELIIQRKDS